MTNLWSELKASQSGDTETEQGSGYTWLYIGIGVVVAAAAGVIIYKVVQKKKRDFADAED